MVKVHNCSYGVGATPVKNMRVSYTAKDITDMTDHSVNQGWSQIS
jgi:hypothetical protein